MIIKKQHSRHLAPAASTARPYRTMSQSSRTPRHCKLLRRRVIAWRVGHFVIFSCSGSYMNDRVKYTRFFSFFLSFSIFCFLIPCCMHLIIWDRLAKYRVNKTFRKWYFPLRYIHFVLINQCTAFLYDFVWQNETGTIIFRSRKCNHTQRK